MTAAVCDPEVIECPLPFDGITVCRIVAEPVVVSRAVARHSSEVEGNTRRSRGGRVDINVNGI